jgi:hypothetical protein
MLQPKFEGKSDILKGFIYDCSNRCQFDRYTIVTREIAEFVGRDYTYGGDIRWTLENEIKFIVPVPEELSDKEPQLRRGSGRDESMNSSNERTSWQRTARQCTP